jgi:hypothetical protein
LIRDALMTERFDEPVEQSDIVSTVQDATQPRAADLQFVCEID